jgi:hypothetical protein
MEGGFWGLSLDLMALAKVPVPDPCSETDEEALLDTICGLLEVWVASGIGAKFKPTLPVFGP